jgi:hypothetical protein
MPFYGQNVTHDFEKTLLAVCALETVKLIELADLMDRGDYVGNFDDSGIY